MSLLERAVSLIEEQQYNLALSDLNEVIRHDPTCAMAFYFRGYIFISLGENGSAVADLGEAIRIEPNKWDSYMLRASVFHQQGDLDQALDDYTQVITLNPALASAYCGRGVIYHTLRDYNSALEDYTEAIQLDPQNGRVYRFRGQALFEVDQYGEALADLTEALRLDPGSAEALVYRSRILEAVGEVDAAMADLTEGIRLDPACAEAYCCRATIACALGQFQQAVNDFSAAIHLTPRDMSAYQGRALAWEGLGEDDKADQDHTTAQQLQCEGDTMLDSKTLVHPLLKTHFAPITLGALVVTERRFPNRVRADLQRAIDGLFETMTVKHFGGVQKRGSLMGINFTDLVVQDGNDPAKLVPPQYEEIDVGEDEPIRCLKSGLWLVENNGSRFAIFQEPENSYQCRMEVIRFQVAAVNDEKGTASTQQFFKHLEEGVRQARSYRGKILSLEVERNYSGASTGIKVHKLRHVAREQVILPPQTLELLDRNVIQFVRQRPQLAKVGMATKKGLLFYGPPGTGKTHTIHYLAGALEQTTTLLISAEQVGWLGDYMTLARLLQPSMVIIEDADLIARERTSMGSVYEEVLLNKLLNEMDGLREDADILFILTTNRPEALEAALASRPGRIDQAIEFPFPDKAGRSKLVRLYARGEPLSDEVVEITVKKTDGVSPAFIKELLRRAMQYRLERNTSAGITLEDVDNALEELLFKGGALNRKLLGGQVEEQVPSDE